MEPLNLRNNNLKFNGSSLLPPFIEVAVVDKSFLALFKMTKVMIEMSKVTKCIKERKSGGEKIKPLKFNIIKWS